MRVPRLPRALLGPLLARMGFGGRLARGALLVLVLQTATVAVGYLLQVFLARWMGAPAYGSYTYVFAWASTAATVAGLGFSSAVLRFIPSYRAQRAWPLLHGLVRRSIGLTSGSGLVLALIGTAVLLLPGPRGGHGSSSLFLLGLWCLPLLVLTKLLAEVLRATHRVGLAYASPILLRLLIAAGAAALLLWGRPLTSTSVLAVALFALVVLCGLQALLLRPSFPPPTWKASPAYATRHWLRVALPLLLVAVFSLLNSRVDVLLLGFFVESKAIGVYNASARTASLVSLFLFAVNAVAAPAIASIHTQQGTPGLQRLVRTMARWIFWPSLLAALGLFAFAQPILRIFGPAFAEGLWPLRILTLGHLVDAGAGPVGNLLNLTGHQDLSARVYGWCALLNVAFNGLAIPTLGIVGAASATTLTIVLRNLWLYVLVVRTLRVHPFIFAPHTGIQPR